MTDAGRILDRPEPCFVTLRIVKGGPRVPARIFRAVATDPATGEPLDRSAVLQAQLGTDEPTADPGAIHRIWTHGRFIDEAEYHHLVRVARWAEQHAPHLPEANAGKPVDLGRMPPLF